MEEKPELTLDDKLDIVAQLCSGLGYAHSQGVVHRDVKPANVFLLQDGTVKLLDFGIAKLATSTLTRQGDVVGSAPYMSPEQIAGAQDLDGRSDVWSTGVLLYELLTGRKPFDGEGLTTLLSGILREQPTPIDKYVPGLPQALLNVVAKALEKDRDKRYQTAEELGRELQLIRKTHQLSAPPPMDETRFASTNVLKALHDDRQKQDAGANKTLVQQPPAPVAPSSTPGSKTWMIAAGAVIVLMGAAGGYFVMNKPAPSTPTQAPAANTPVNQPANPQPQPVQQGPAPVNPPANTAAAASNAANTTKPPVETKTASATPTKSTPKKSEPAASSPAPAVATAPAPPPAARATVAVSITGGYEFQVMDGSRVISAAARSHELPLQPNGKTLRLVAPDVFLEHSFKIDGGSDNQFDYTAPGLGMIEIRAARGDCKANVGKKDLGFGPWKPIPIAAGDYRVELICPDGQNPFQNVTVTQGRTARVPFTAK
jgi:serine/threonine-protein kinase